MIAGPATALGGRSILEDAMFRKLKEYSLDELIEHPILSVQIASEGIDRRGLDLMFDEVNSHHRFIEAGEGDTD
jgi:hypothetical protein